MSPECAENQSKPLRCSRHFTHSRLQGIADALFEDNAVAQTARPGTAFNRPVTSAAGKVSHL